MKLSQYRILQLSLQNIVKEINKQKLLNHKETIVVKKQRTNKEETKTKLILRPTLPPIPE